MDSRPAGGIRRLAVVARRRLLRCCCILAALAAFPLALWLLPVAWRWALLRCSYWADVHRGRGLALALRTSGRTAAASLDVVLSTYDEPPAAILGHLNSCCAPRGCRVFVYHHTGGEPRTRHFHAAKSVRVRSSAEDWKAIPTEYAKEVHEVPNAWGADEATAYLTHIAARYHDLAPITVFLHGHVSSKHSHSACDIINMGVARLVPPGSSGKGFADLNKPQRTRCLSPRGIEGRYFKTNLRDTVYSQWRAWTNSSDVPERLTVTCCAQFAVKSSSIRERPLGQWEHMLKAAEAGGRGIPWEFLWPTLMDQTEAAQAGSC